MNSNPEGNVFQWRQWNTLLFQLFILSYEDWQGQILGRLKFRAQVLEGFTVYIRMYIFSQVDLCVAQTVKGSLCSSLCLGEYCMCMSVLICVTSHVHMCICGLHMCLCLLEINTQTHSVPLMGDSSSQATSMWVLPTGCSPSGTGCSNMVPPWGSPILPENLLQHGLLSLHGSWQDPAPAWACLLQASTCSGIGSSLGCRWISARPWTSMDCRGTACLIMVFITGCRGKLSSLASGAPPSPLSSLTLVSAGCFFHIVSLLSLDCCLTTILFPFLYMLSQRCYHGRWLAWPWPAVGLS